MTLGASLLDFPEQNDAKSFGWGVNAVYDSLNSSSSVENSGGGSFQNFTVNISLSYNSVIFAEDISYDTLKVRLNKRGQIVSTAQVSYSQWIELRQDCISPIVTLSFFKIIDLTSGYAIYSYNQNVGDFSQKLAKLTSLKTVKNANFSGATSLVNGFPNNIFSVGAAYSIIDDFKINYDWSRTNYELDVPKIDSSTLTLTYTLISTLELKASYNILSNSQVFTGSGIKWIW
jgi:hypothetical protein